MLTRFTSVLTCCWGILFAANAIAGLPKQSYLPAEQAIKAVSAAVEQCQKDGYQVSAAVVDRSGVVVAQLRANGAGAHTIDSSKNKAYSSASLKEPTQKLAKLITKIPEIVALRDMNQQILLLGGGFPIRFDDEVVGGIGVGGAPGAHLDEACARAGLKSINAALYKDGD